MKIFCVLRPLVIFLFIVSALIVLAIIAPWRRFGLSPNAFFRWWSRSALWIYGIEVEVFGNARPAPGIIVSNHVSYWDIVVLGSRYDGVFVAKSEVAGWPIIGWAARLMRTIFISRRSRKSAITKLNEFFSQHDSHSSDVIIFPEGTTSAAPCLEFKSGAFHLAHRTGRILKPLALAYDAMDRMAWLKEDSLTGHIARLTFAPRCRCTVVELPVVDPKDFEDPIQMKQACRRSIQRGFDAAMSGQAESFVSF